VGSLFYLAYAAGHAEFSDLEWLWATIAFTIGLSVLVHGVLAKPAMDWLERANNGPENAPVAGATSPG
jgi:NhaP-type Na+/H+ or K+/H+ antiporter